MQDWKGQADIRHIEDRVKVADLSTVNAIRTFHTELFVLIAVDDLRTTSIERSVRRRWSMLSVAIASLREQSASWAKWSDMKPELVVVLTVAVVSYGGFREPKTSASALQQSCQWETFKASCASPDHVIVMQRAQYGRMRRGRCVKRDFGHQGCAANVLSIADKLCSGRPKCSVPVYETFGHLRPCSELESYFEATFTCVEVSFRESHCSPNDPAVPVTTSRSVASWNTGQSPGGATGSCSYQLHVQSGQRWKLTLLDFTSVSPKKTATKPNLANEVSATRDVPTCLKYARVKEGNLTDFVVCGGHSRVRTVYLSQAHSVRVDFLADRWRSDSVEPKFIFRFEVSACEIWLLIYSICKSESTFMAALSFDFGIGCSFGFGVCGSFFDGRTPCTVIVRHLLPVALVDIGGVEPYRTSGSRSSLIPATWPVVGCPDPIVASNVRWRRHGDDVVFSCTATAQKWRMRCHSGLWLGKHMECLLKPHDRQWNNWRNGSQSAIHDMVLMVMLGVSIGVIIGVMLLLIATVSLNRRQCEATEHVPLSVLPEVTGRNLKLRAYCCSHASLVRASPLRDTACARTLPSYGGYRRRPVGSLPQGLWIAGGQEFEMTPALSPSERLSSSSSSILSSPGRSNLRVTQLVYEQTAPPHVYESPV
ncbi:hypothetical protein LSAT2_006147 [Lamellibrachia satsuma]|nr:hypothetical protein LSAT2_006147 [Lamellibrachia satsuma]